MAKKHGRYASPVTDRSNDLGHALTTPGFKATRYGAGIERVVEGPARVIERPDFKAITLARAKERAAQKESARVAMKAQVAERVAARAAKNVKPELEGKRPQFGKDAPKVWYTKRGKRIADWTETAPVRAQVITRAEPKFTVYPPTKTKSIAPDLDHLKRENATPATPPKPNAEPKVEVVTLKPDPVADKEYREWKRERNIKDALESQDPTASKTTNAKLLVVDTPGGVAKYHEERQRTALEIAKGTKGADRRFALELAKHHGSEKRKANAKARAQGHDVSGQKRVPAGSPKGGEWTK